MQLGPVILSVVGVDGLPVTADVIVTTDGLAKTAVNSKITFTPIGTSVVVTCTY
jgi:hypothetical protein